ncbi:uncharacterized protein LOC111097552 [Canis lupus familiaris]|uniref:uncharacterized protein LOC111097552 n=1 Tax=Canis lupus familiaris TaxID=9615 RepID=UPI0018F57226|nr:uncharacterized protein LOC111097552 [Canis lupus familiaris]XP_038531183.1 uncharacterized protein LOC111097552 [Canis lupus familiaris]
MRTLRPQTSMSAAILRQMSCAVVKMGSERPAAWIQIWRLRLRALASAGAGLESSRFLPRIFQGPLTPSASTGSWAVGWNIQERKGDFRTSAKNFAEIFLAHPVQICEAFWVSSVPSGTEARSALLALQLLALVLLWPPLMAQKTLRGCAECRKQVDHQQRGQDEEGEAAKEESPKAVGRVHSSRSLACSKLSPGTGTRTFLGNGTWLQSWLSLHEQAAAPVGTWENKPPGALGGKNTHK